MLHTAPSASPKDVRVCRKTQSSVTIIWKEVDCDHTNGLIVGYQINLYLSAYKMREEFVEGSDSRRYRLENMTFCKHLYSVAVAAVNQAGVGLFTDRIQLGKPQGVVHITIYISTILVLFC